MNPMRSSLPSSSWLVATVVPWLTAVTADPGSPIRSSTLRTPLRKPSAGSAGVDGVFVVVIWPDSSSTATTSVNVPPVSMPMRTRRSLMGGYFSAEIPGGEDPSGSRFGPPDARDVQRAQDRGGRSGHVQPPRVDELAGGQADGRPDREVQRDRAGRDDRQDPHRRAGVAVREHLPLARRGRWGRGLGQVGGDPDQLATRLGGPRRLHADVELVQVQLPVADRPAQPLLDDGPFGVGDAQRVGAYRLVHEADRRIARLGCVRAVFYGS